MYMNMYERERERERECVSYIYTCILIIPFILPLSQLQVEWGFGCIGQKWPFLSAKRNFKILDNPIGAGKVFTVASLLSNAHTCLQGNIVSLYFKVSPPSLESYFGGGVVPRVGLLA